MVMAMAPHHMTSPNAAPDSAARAPSGRTIASLPGPRGWPLVGNLLQLERTRVHHTVEQWAQRFGPVFRIRLGPTPFLVVADHEAIRAVLRDRPDGFRRPPRLDIVWREMGFSPGVFGANGDAWKRQRRMVMAGFDPAHVRAYVPALARVTQRLRQRWSVAAQHGQPIDLQGDLMRFTVDAIAGLAFGSEVNTLQSDEVVIQHHLDKIFPAVARRMLAPYPYWRHVKTPADRRLDTAVREVNRAVADFIHKARARLSASAQRRARPENLHETMRLKPVAPLNVLQALRDTEVAEVEVPARTMLWCVMRHDTVREQLFADAQRFDPARWMAQCQDVPSATSAKRVSMPFGAGPRICPGRYLALLEMKMAMAMLLNSFEIATVGVPDGAELREVLSFTMAPAGLVMRLNLRAA